MMDTNRARASWLAFMIACLMVVASSCSGAMWCGSAVGGPLFWDCGSGGPRGTCAWNLALYPDRNLGCRTKLQCEQACYASKDDLPDDPMVYCSWEEGCSDGDCLPSYVPLQGDDDQSNHDGSTRSGT